MIDLKAARNDPHAARAALVRRGAGDAFDELLRADEEWRALVPRVDELRAQQKLDGKPTPEQLERLKQVKEELKASEERLAAAGTARRPAPGKGAEPPHEAAGGGGRGGDAGGGGG